MFIVIEGIDYTGKTTLAQNLAEWFMSLNLTASVRGGYNTDKASQDIRKIVVSREYDTPMDPMTETLLYLAGLKQEESSFIIPRLKNKEVVISDRGIGSTIVYQGMNGLAGSAFVCGVISDMKFCEPDIVINLLSDDIETLFKDRRPTDNTKLDRKEILPVSFFEGCNRDFSGLTYGPNTTIINILNVEQKGVMGILLEATEGVVRHANKCIR